MPDRRRSSRYTQPVVPYNALVASAQQLSGPTLLRHIIQNREWQREAWDFYHAMGEFWYGVNWFSSAMSRVRLKAAKLVPGADEPEILDADAKGDDGRVVEAVSMFGGGTGGQSAILKSMAVKLSVPGEGYVIAEKLNGVNVWSTKSADEVRPRERGKTSRRSRKSEPTFESQFEIQVEEGQWRQLDTESLVCRIWLPDEQYSWRACSAALPALPILRELDLINRRIITDLVSRLVMNGILAIPEEMTLPVREEFKDRPDPFIAELIDVASRSIANPGAASGAIPIPIRGPAELIDKIKHVPFATPLDPRLMDTRDRSLKRLAVTLNMPEEVITGVQNVNHWTAWQIDESGIKIHISPIAEVLCHGFTLGFLHPTLEVNDIPIITKKNARYVMWYDATELTAKPDLAQNANDAYDRLEISGTSYRREMGFNEEDAPTKDELKELVLKNMISKAQNPQAAGELVGVDVAPPEPVVAPPPGEEEKKENVPPGTPRVVGPPPAERPSTSFETIVTELANAG